MNIFSNKSLSLLDVLILLCFPPFASAAQARMQKASVEVTVAGVKSSCEMLMSMSSTNGDAEHIPLDIFKEFLRHYCRHYKGFEGLSRSDRCFERDYNMLMAVLYKRYAQQMWGFRHNCVTGNGYAAGVGLGGGDTIHDYSLAIVPDLIPRNDEWQESFDAPSSIPLFDLRTSSTARVVHTIERHMGNISNVRSNELGEHTEKGRGLPVELCVQLFVTLILQGDTDLVHLDMASNMSGDGGNLVAMHVEIDAFIGSPSTTEAGALGGSTEDTRAGHTEPVDLPSTSERLECSFSYKKPPQCSGTTLYFDNGIRLCWLASQFLYLDEINERKRANWRSWVACNMQCYFILTAIQRVLSSRVFDTCMDIIFAMAMLVFVFAETTPGMMIACVALAVTEALLKSSTFGRLW